MTEKKRILIYVQHLLGSGHLVRAFSLAKGLAHHGHEVHLLSGGMTVPHLAIEQVAADIPHLHFYQLPAMKSADSIFSAYVDKYNNDITPEWQATRASLLLNYVKEHVFDMAIIEAYPFGRRQMEFELIPLLDYLKQQGVYICSSIRDVLQRRKEKRYVETVDRIGQYFDKVLVHADKRFIRLGDSFPLAASIQEKLFYTGYIYNDTKSSDSAVEYTTDVIVSAGGSNVGLKMLRTAILAKPYTVVNQHVWRILYSPAFMPKEVGELKTLADGDANIIIEPNRKDFRSLLKHAALSISQAGYNTSLDILNNGTPSVMVPFASGGETEQTDRAGALANSGYVINVDEQRLTTAALVDAVNKAVESSHDSPTRFIPDMQGVENTCKWVNQLLLTVD